MNAKFDQNKTYKIHPEIEESDERYTFSHYNESGCAFFNTVGKSSESDKMFWLSLAEIEDQVLVEA